MRSAKHLVVGAGVHGLSTAWHLAQQREEVLVVDKASVASGASGIACGVIRNNYVQPAMSELMAACVEIWESDPETLHYHGSGYIALGPEAQVQDEAVQHAHKSVTLTTNGKDGGTTWHPIHKVCAGIPQRIIAIPFLTA